MIGNESLKIQLAPLFAIKDRRHRRKHLVRKSAKSGLLLGYKRIHTDAHTQTHVASTGESSRRALERLSVHRRVNGLVGLSYHVGQALYHAQELSGI